MNASDRHAFFAQLRELNPQPTTELHYGSTFELLIAVMLSAQATDLSVNKVTARLFPLARTPADMLALGEARVRELIQTIGLYRAKAKNVVATCAKLIDEHGGDVPHERVALEALPGVGRKTANVVLNTAFGEPVIAVDTHLFRVANRTGLAKGKTPLAVELGLLKRVPAEFLRDAHHWLILHGRYVCKARAPACATCVVSVHCDFAKKSARALSKVTPPRGQ
jgi:endonuclease III